MFDKLIDLMTCINAIDKTSNSDEKLRRIKLAIDSLKAIDSSLQKMRSDLENPNLGPKQNFITDKK